ncbi:MAG: CRISPR-associated endonuclease Cas2 [Caldisphaera sp.]
MYCILVYDIAVARVNKICNFLRMYLNWVQNSVFEGEIDEVALMRIRDFLNENLNKNIDSVIIYTFYSQKQVRREIMGIEKSKLDQII